MEKKQKEKNVSSVSEDLEDEVDPDAEDGDKEETDDWDADY